MFEMMFLFTIYTAPHKEMGIEQPRVETHKVQQQEINASNITESKIIRLAHKQNPKQR